MAQNGAVIVFCSSCKILYFASSVHPKIATEVTRHDMLNSVEVRLYCFSLSGLFRGCGS